MTSLFQLAQCPQGSTMCHVSKFSSFLNWIILPVSGAGRTLDPGSDSELAVPECGVAAGPSLGARHQSLCSWGVLAARSIWAASPLALRGLSCHPNSRWSGNEGSLQYQPEENLIQLAKHRVRKACGLTHVILLGGVGFQRLRTNSWARAGIGQWNFVVFSVSASLPGLGAFLLHPRHTCVTGLDPQPIIGQMLIRYFIWCATQGKCDDTNPKISVT